NASSQSLDDMLYFMEKRVRYGPPDILFTKVFVDSDGVGSVGEVFDASSFAFILRFIKFNVYFFANSGDNRLKSGGGRPPVRGKLVAFSAVLVFTQGINSLFFCQRRNVKISSTHYLQ
ncbi:MAG: hypothetical protein ACPHYH_05205, partial [Flavobacteriaceae bacterium]